MNLYSNKQKWKIALMIFALLLVGVSLFVSNQIVAKVGEQEHQRATQWAGAIKKKVELVQLTNRTFSKLRDKEREKMSLWVEATKEVSNPSSFDIIPEFPMRIIKGNFDIPVILLDGSNTISGHRNVGFDKEDLKVQFPELSEQELSTKFNDSLLQLAEIWKSKHPSFTIEVYTDLFMTYVYNDSKELVKLEQERDSLIHSFNQELIDNEGRVPVLLIDAETQTIIGSNLPEEKLRADKLSTTINEMSNSKDTLMIDFKDGHKSILYYDDSPELKQLQYFPYIQFVIIGLFALIGYLIFSTFRKAEQNQVWAGMAKETAHQLGTPLSSLMAWVQLLESYNVDPMVAKEMQKDVDRLEKVTDRFSKIGSGAKLDSYDLTATVENVIEYLRPRISKQVTVDLVIKEKIETVHNGPLIEWVIENICKNAVDAMDGKGQLKIEVIHGPEWAHIDISDTGKGISPKQMKTIFQPGFTTKKRGWGLGLSLVKRIVKEYHKGRVFVLHSTIGVGTTFRISIPLKQNDH